MDVVNWEGTGTVYAGKGGSTACWEYSFLL